MSISSIPNEVIVSFSKLVQRIRRDVARVGQEKSEVSFQQILLQILIDLDKANILIPHTGQQIEGKTSKIGIQNCTFLRRRGFSIQVLLFFSVSMHRKSLKLASNYSAFDSLQLPIEIYCNYSYSRNFGLRNM